MHVEGILAASDGRVALAWVIHDGEAVHVRTFRQLRPGHRPAVFCPVCERQVTPKLGERRAPHAAHHKGAVCPTTDPDFALYVNATFSLAEALRLNLLQIVDPERCQRGEADLPCKAERAHLWVERWDAVRWDVKEGSTAPNVELLLDGQSVAALLVSTGRPADALRVSHLEAADVQWACVDAVNVLDVAEPAIASEEPAELYLNNESSRRVCPTCSTVDKLRALMQRRVHKEYEPGEVPRHVRFAAFRARQWRIEMFITWHRPAGPDRVEVRLSSDHAGTICSATTVTSEPSTQELLLGLRAYKARIHGKDGFQWRTEWIPFGEELVGLRAKDLIPAGDP